MDARIDDAAERLKVLLAAPPPPLADGVYFGLAKEAYHRDPALGSSDMKRLAYSPPDYWFYSHMNPTRPPDTSTEPQMRGTAVHVLVLEGESAFDARYQRGPDQEGMSPSEKAQSTKAANVRAAAAGKECLRALDYDRVAVAGAMIMRNPKLTTAFQGGASEVSVFWTDVCGAAGRVTIRKKARLDYLKPRGVGDLKSVANQHEVPFAKACVNAITNYNYHVQAQHYLIARAVMPALIRDGKVHGASEAVSQLLQNVVDAKRWAWQWIFWQSERAPITYSRILSPGNSMLDVAGVVLARAEQNYLQYLDMYGESMWVEEAIPQELFLEDMPPWFARD